MSNGEAARCTRRDRQAEAKKAGAPWDAAKAFDRSAPLGALTPRAAAGAMTAARIWLSVNGQTRQDANIDQMIWSLPEIIAALSRSWALAPGDLIFTGTPAAASPTTQVRQGYLEASGVDAARAMVDMIISLRTFEANQRVIRTLDDTLGRLVNSAGAAGGA